MTRLFSPALLVLALLACGPDTSDTDATDTSAEPTTPLEELLQCEPELMPRCEHEPGDPNCCALVPLPCTTEALRAGQPGTYTFDYFIPENAESPHRDTLVIHDDGRVSAICESLFTERVTVSGWRCDFIPPPDGHVLYNLCACGGSGRVDCIVADPAVGPGSEWTRVLDHCEPSLSCPDDR